VLLVRAGRRRAGREAAQERTAADGPGRQTGGPGTGLGVQEDPVNGVLGTGHGAGGPGGR